MAPHVYFGVWGGGRVERSGPRSGSLPTAPLSRDSGLGSYKVLITFLAIGALAVSSCQLEPGRAELGKLGAG